MTDYTERDELVKRLQAHIEREWLTRKQAGLAQGLAMIPAAGELETLLADCLAALSAQQSQEPVAWMYVTRYGNKVLSFLRIPDSAWHDYYAEYALIFKERGSYAKIFDDTHGTPCEQIWWQQKIEELECKLSEEKEITQRLALELDGYRKSEADINNALNTGNGTYSP